MQKFWKFSLLPNLLYRITIELAVEKFYLMSSAAAFFHHGEILESHLATQMTI